MSFIIGLTGSIASGKSTVSGMFAELDIPVIDADILSRTVVEPGEKAYEEIVAQFSRDILLPDGAINRSELGRIIFADEEKRKQLNAIVHPAVREKMLAERDTYVKMGYPCVVLDIPLLFESKLTHFVDMVVLVFVKESLQLKRLRERDGYSKEEAFERIHSQLSMEEKRNLADVVLDNGGTKEQTRQQLRNFLTKQHII